jgi:hypothetical protein
MDLLENISSLYNNPVTPSSSYLIIPEGIFFNGHIQMGIAMIGFWFLVDLFDLLFWNDWRILRRKIKERILNFLNL